MSYLQILKLLYELGIIFPFFTGEVLKSNNPDGEEREFSLRAGQSGWKAQALSPVGIASQHRQGTSTPYSICHRAQDWQLLVSSVLVLYSIGTELTHLS